MMEAGRALDSDVAIQVMDWSVELIVNSPHDTFEEWRDAQGCRYGVVPAPFSTDLWWAWQVVEHMRSLGWTWHINVGLENAPQIDAGRVAPTSDAAVTTTVDVERAGVRHYNLDGKFVGPGSKKISVRGKSLTDHSMDDVPLAICRAALAALNPADLMPEGLVNRGLGS